MAFSNARDLGMIPVADSEVYHVVVFIYFGTVVGNYRGLLARIAKQLERIL